MNKFGIVFIIFFGEALMILAEMWGARQYQPGVFWNVFLKMLVVMGAGGALLVAGYVLGYSSFKNIWVVSVVSITSILIIEPTLAYLIFHQTPTRGAAAGLLLGALGLALSLFWK